MQAISALNWFTSQELAGQPGLPNTEQNVRIKAKQEHWPSRKRSGSKAMEYPFSCLPSATQAALLKKAVSQVTSAFAEAPKDQQEQALEVLRAADKGAASQDLPMLAVSSDAAQPGAQGVTGDGRRARADFPRLTGALSVGAGKQSKHTLPALRRAANEALTQRQILSRDARLLVVNGLHKLMKTQQLSARAACQQLCDWVKAGEVDKAIITALALGHNKSGLEWSIKINPQGQPVAEALPGQDITAKAKTVSRRTLERWVAAAKDGEQALAPAVRQKDMSIAPWMPLLLSRLNRPQKPPLALAYREACLAASQQAIAMLSYDTAKRWYSQKFSRFDAKRGRYTGSALNPFKRSQKRDSSGLSPMGEIHSDGWSTHFVAPHPVSGHYVKLEVWHTHDVATRYVFKPAVGLSESRALIMQSLRHAIAEGGIPVFWQTDNTSSVKNASVEFDALCSIRARGGFTIVHNQPGNSQANGIAESFNRELDACAKALATYQHKPMDSLSARNVHKITQKLIKTADAAERQRLIEQAERQGQGLLLTSFEEAVALIERWCDAFNDKPHRSLPRITCPKTGQRRHQTPREAWQAHIKAGWQPVAYNEDDLRDLFLVHERRTVQRGTVTLIGQSYYHPDLLHFNGETVQIAYDIEDGERVWVKTLDGRLIAEAEIEKTRSYRTRSVWDAGLEKRAEAAIKRHQGHIEAIEAQREPLAIEHSPQPLIIPGLGDVTNPQSVAARLAQLEAEEAEVVESEEHPSPPAPLPQAGEGSECAADNPEHEDEAAQLDELTPEARYRFWQALDKRVQAGEKLHGRLHHFYRLYPASKAFAIQQELAEEQAQATVPVITGATGGGRRLARA